MMRVLFVDDDPNIRETAKDILEEAGYEIEAVGTEKRLQPNSVANVEIMVDEVLCYATQPLEIPGGIAGIAEIDLAHVVVHAVDVVALPVKMFDRFRAN